ncbi:MAG: CinA family protein, partial [Epsilonproteobacteria bacterium]|nr:CinA family protein [Campylobacterota bacterium]
MKDFLIYLFVDIDISDVLKQFETVDFTINDAGDYKELSMLTKIGENNDIEKIRATFAERAGKDVCFGDPFYLTAELLLKAGLTLSTVESCTGGLIGKRLTDMPGSSRYYDGGFITYSNAAKAALGVDESVIKKYGAVSEQTAYQMAKACLKNSSADISVSVTGIAGPDGATEDKPKG